jgi:hypothetical protein
MIPNVGKAESNEAIPAHDAFDYGLASDIVEQDVRL